MKKIFTLLFAVGILTAAANAQTGSRDNRSNPQYGQKPVPQTDQRDTRQYDPRNDQQNGQWDKDNSYNSNSRYGRGIEMQIAQINRTYDIQVQKVKNSFFMKRFEKARKLRALEEQRQQEIRMVYARSTNSRGRGYDANHHY